MNRIVFNIVMTVLAFVSTSAFAQSITIGPGNGNPGDLVTVPVNFTAGGTSVGNFTIDVTFDATKFSSATGDCAVQAVSQDNSSCTNSSGKVRITAVRGSGALTTGLAANLKLTIAGGASAGPVTLTGTMVAVGFDGNDLALNAISVNNGTLTVEAGPQPLFASTPTPATGVNLGTVAKEGTNPSANVVINNTGGATSTTLTGTCSETADVDNVFTISGDTNFSVPQAGPTDTVAVSCNANGAVGAHVGTMSCAHNGSNATPQNYTLSCTIAGPTFTSAPVAGTPLTFTATEQNDPDPTKTISVTNTGFAGTKLDVTCTDTVDPDGVFSVTGGAFVDLTPAGPAKTVTVTCDSAGSVKTHTGTLSCSHNGTNTTPATYALSCEITPPGAGIFSSVPAPGSTIDLTPEPVAVGTNVSPKSLVISNIADAGDQNLLVGCYFSSGDAPPISQSPITNDTFTLEADGASVTANFDCNTSQVGSYSANFQCGYANNGTGTVADTKAFDSFEDYTVKCDVRAPAAKIEPAPAPNTPQEAVVPPGGSHTFSFVFNETNDEGVDGTLESCTLDNGANYDILTPASFPVAVPAGGSVTVQVKGTDPGGVDNFADVLSCVYRNYPLPEIPEGGQGIPPVNVSWPLNIIVGGDASFRVVKEFNDYPNPTEVEVTISCNTGLPITQSQTISETRDVTFIVQSFDTGELDCTITEDLSDPALVGYTPYYNNGLGGDPDIESCAYTDVKGGDENICAIINTVDPVPVVIQKDWIIDGIGGDQIDQHFELTLYCDSKIVGGYGEANGLEAKGPAQVECGPADPMVVKGKSGYAYKSCLELEGSGDTTFTPEVIPAWPSTHCWVDEEVYDDAAEVDNGCLDIEVSHGQGAECLITNTVFFEGIPTLSQYGMAIMALLMLGMGLVGFRRFI